MKTILWCIMPIFLVISFIAALESTNSAYRGDYWLEAILGKISGCSLCIFLILLVIVSVI